MPRWRQTRVDVVGEAGWYYIRSYLLWLRDGGETCYRGDSEEISIQECLKVYTDRTATIKGEGPYDLNRLRLHYYTEHISTSGQRRHALMRAGQWYEAGVAQYHRTVFYSHNLMETWTLNTGGVQTKIGSFNFFRVGSEGEATDKASEDSTSLLSGY
ncbi:hypothetical protein Tco_0754652 [Tanacetum coccineum]